MATKTADDHIVKPYKPGKPQYTGHTVVADLNYYADPGDGSPPTPVIVGR